MALLKRVLLLVCTLALLFGVGEWVTRRSTLEAYFDKAKRYRASRDPELARLPRFKSVMDLAKKNVRGNYKGALHRTNDHGFRGPDYEPVPAPGVTRILVTGDSVVMGDGVPEDEIYTNRIAGLLRRDAGLRAEVINTGVSGANVDDAMDRLEKGLDAYGADLLVYGFTINDIEGPDYQGASEAEKTHWTQTRKGPFGQTPSYLLNKISRLIAELGAPKRHADTWYAKELRTNYFDNAPAWDTLMDGFDRYGAIADERGVCAHVMVHTHLIFLDEGHAYRDVYERVAREARARGLTVTETWSAFAGRDPNALWVSIFDSHPNAEGHAILADALAADLARLPARCFVAAKAPQAAGEGERQAGDSGQDEPAR